MRCSARWSCSTWGCTSGDGMEVRGAQVRGGVPCGEQVVENRHPTPAHSPGKGTRGDRQGWSGDCAAPGQPALHAWHTHTPHYAARCSQANETQTPGGQHDDPQRHLLVCA